MATGCGGGTGALDALLDKPSRERLQALPTEATLLVALAVEEPGVDLDLPDGFTQLGRSGAAALVQVNPEARETVLPPEVVRASIWGDLEIVPRMDPRLRGELLDAWRDATETPISAIATFQDETPNLRERLTELGIGIGSIAGPIVTVNADFNGILAVLGMPELLTLSAPRQLRPSGG